MPVYGDLKTVSLTDLLRWAASNKKTGVLEVERKGISRRIEFRKGCVGSCQSNDPSSMLGQFLLSRGRINETQLQHLLALQRMSKKRLGLLLVELRLLGKGELASEVAAKAEETIHSLFDWDDAFFRFDDGATLDPDQIEVTLSVEELVAEGQKRAEEVKGIRRVFTSSGMVLRRTEHEVPPGILDKPMTRRMLDSIDGQRTIAEMLLHTRCSEFLVLQFLRRLYERGLLEVVEVRPVPDENATLLDTIKPDVAGIREEGRKRELEAGLSSPDDASGDPESAGGLDVEIEAATRLMERKEYEAAVELLRATCRGHADVYARRLLLRAEEAFVEAVKQEGRLSTKVPVLLTDRHALMQQALAPEESFLLGLVDGVTDVQCILWLSPLREVDGLFALRRMMDKGMIELADPSVASLHGAMA